LSRGLESLSQKNAIKPNMTFQEKIQNVNAGKFVTPLLSVGTQRRFMMNLNDIYDLRTNGEYTVQVSRNVINASETYETNVFSGKATFLITK
jgi:hypothetical protein